jgi:hypothetical protein
MLDIIGAGRSETNVAFIMVSSLFDAIVYTVHIIKNIEKTRKKKYQHIISITMIPVKVQLVLFTILITLIVSAPATYKVTDMLIGTPLNMPFLVMGSSPSPIGIIVHALVAGLLMYLYLLTFRV